MGRDWMRNGVYCCTMSAFLALEQSGQWHWKVHSTFTYNISFYLIYPSRCRCLGRHVELENTIVLRFDIALLRCISGDKVTK